MGAELGRRILSKGYVDTVAAHAETAITFGRHELFDVLRVATMPELENQTAHVCDVTPAI
jgi:hypothetical protein